MTEWMNESFLLPNSLSAFTIIKESKIDTNLHVQICYKDPTKYIRICLQPN